MESNNLCGLKAEFLSICRLCLEVSTIDLHPAESLKLCLLSIIPKLDLTLSENPGICNQCTDLLTKTYNFKLRCLTNQEIIQNRYNASKSPVNLSNLLKDVESSSTSCNKSTKNLIKDENEHLFDESKYLENSDTDDEFQEYDVKEPNFNLKIVDIKECDKITIDSEECAIKNRIDLEVIQKKLPDLSTSDLTGNGSDAGIYKERSDLLRTSSGFLKLEQVCFNYCENESTKESPKNQSFLVQSKFSDLDDSTEHVTQYDMDSPFKFTPLSEKLVSGRYRCSLCGKEAAQKLHIDGHLLKKHHDIAGIINGIQSKIHICKFCGYRTINTRTLENHIEKKHLKMMSIKPKLFCLHCNYSTDNKTHLEVHMRRHSSWRPFICQYCNKEFNQKNGMLLHYLRRHPKEVESTSLAKKLYLCNICGFKTMTRSCYFKHVDRHIKKKDVVNSSSDNTLNNLI